MALHIGLEGSVGIPVEQAVDLRGACAAVELDEADAAFQQTAGEDAVAGVAGLELVGIVRAVEARACSAISRERSDTSGALSCIRAARA